MCDRHLWCVPVELQSVEGPHPPSMRLATVLPADLTSSSTSLEAAALSRVPAELQQQEEEVKQLWQQLQQYMQEFEGMRSMVQHLVGSAAHPYAIDAVQLRAYGQAAGIDGMAAAPAAGEDCSTPQVKAAERLQHNMSLEDACQHTVVAGGNYALATDSSDKAVLLLLLLVLLLLLLLQPWTLLHLWRRGCLMLARSVAT